MAKRFIGLMAMTTSVQNWMTDPRSIRPTTISRAEKITIASSAIVMIMATTGVCVWPSCVTFMYAPK